MHGCYYQREYFETTSLFYHLAFERSFPFFPLFASLETFGNLNFKATHQATEHGKQCAGKEALTFCTGNLKTQFKSA